MKIEHKTLEVGESIEIDPELCHIENVTIGPTGHMHLLMVETVPIVEEYDADELTDKERESLLAEIKE